MRWIQPALAAAAIVSLVACQAVAGAQESVQKQFVGTWELRSLMIRAADGSEKPLWGEHPVGRLIYDPQGRMFGLIMPEARNQADGRTIPEALQRDYTGYYGTYVIDTTRQVVTHRVLASVRASESGSIERSYLLQDGQLTLTARGTRDGAPVTYVLTWRRLEP
jgi:hypothetical protein